MKKGRTIFIVSVTLNIVFILIVSVLLFVSRNMKSITFYELTGSPYIHSAFIVGVPEGREPPIFTAVGIFLRRGDIATVQLSSFRSQRQTNQVIEGMFDHSVIAVEPTGYGIKIKALNPGETAIQVFSGFAFRDIIKVFVYD